MKVLVSGGAGLVGRYIVEGLLGAGYQVAVGGRTPPPRTLFAKPVEFVPLSLDPSAGQIAAFAGCNFFVHAAFDHIPGRYRGGEGSDPLGFRHLNLQGSIRLFETARDAGIRRAVFLSSRAVYDGVPPGSILTEDLRLFPPTLYGEVKLQAEHALAGLSNSDFLTSSLRLTGVYGHLRPNKWDALLAQYRSGHPVPPRAGTEVHGRDVAAAVRLMLEADAARISGAVFNVSDILTDTREILSCLPSHPHHLPAAAPDRANINVMSTARIEALGWRGGGPELLKLTVRGLARSADLVA